MAEINGRASPWRWVVLGAFMLVNFIIQVLWICYAPISAEAAKLYGVSELSIGFFAMLFMIAYVPLSVPVAWLIDRFGFKNMVILGSAIMTLSALARGLAGSSYVLALVGTIGLSVSQPFFLNAWTKMPAHWHPQGERATAVGLITLSNLVGIAVGMALTPQLAQSMSIPNIQLVYAAAALVAGLVFALVAREYPKIPVGPMGSGEKALMIEGLKEALASPSFRLLCIVAFVVLGLFNGVNTWIEAIVSSRGLSASDAGTIGAIILGGGIIGAVLLPALSDRSGLRLPWLIVGIVGAIPAILGLAFFANQLLIMISAFFYGFFLTSILPVGMQYSTEVTRPVPEGTTGGLIQLAGQASVVFVFLMDVVRGPSRSFNPALVLSAILLALSAVLVGFMKEAPKAETGATAAAPKARS
ncbi:MAG TPA: MFS transporter [Rectinemataceae bacterium]|nr:MFS transporter [Rectinemataceae bacterium]